MHCVILMDTSMEHRRVDNMQRPPHITVLVYPMRHLPSSGHPAYVSTHIIAVKYCYLFIRHMAAT